jgi:hypothetical protein
MLSKHFIANLEETEKSLLYFYTGLVFSKMGYQVMNLNFVNYLHPQKSAKELQLLQNLTEEGVQVKDSLIKKLLEYSF